MSRLDLITAAGDPFQVGKAIGERAARAFREVVPGVERFRALRRDWSGSARVAALERAARAAFPGHVREMEGIAAGAGADFRDVFLWNCRGDLDGGGDQSAPALHGCTSVMIPARDGEPALIGHNEDDQRELDGHVFLARVEPDDGPAFTSFCSPGLLPGHTFAVNAAGIVQTINHVRPFDQREGIPRHVVCRAVLACTSLDEALGVLARTDRASGFHHNLGEARSGRLVSVEAPASAMHWRPVEAPSAHANHLVFPQLADIEQETAPSSACRQRRALDLIGVGALDGRDPLAVLGDDDGGGLPIRRKGASAADPGFTLASAVFALFGDRVEWRVHGDPRAAPVRTGREDVCVERDGRAVAPG